MTGITLLVLSIFIFVAVAALAMFLLFKVIYNFQPGSNKIKADLIKMKEEIQPWIENLIPWGKEDTELLSRSQVNKEVKKGMTTSIKGVVNSIFHESMIAYSYKKYIAPSLNAILFVRTSHHEFFYRFRGKKIEINIDRHPLGIINDKGELISARTNQILAHIDRHSDELVLPILIKDKEVAGILKPSSSPSPNDRVFEFVNDIKEEEESLVLSLSILEILKSELPS